MINYITGGHLPKIKDAKAPVVVVHYVTFWFN